MKFIWLSVVALGLSACTAPAEKRAPEAKASKSKVTDKQAMAGTGVAAKKSKAMPAATIAGVSATTLAKAIETALLKIPGGEALSAEIEVEKGKAMINVRVFAHGKVSEVEIDAATGTVQEVEDEDDDDDGDDDEDGKDD